MEPYKIRNRVTRSCGCDRRGHGVKNLEGQKFGSLTAIYRKAEKRGSCYLWHCRCDCGKEIDVASNALLSGKTKSCGCAKVNGLRQRSKDITNQRFGRLMALKPLEKRTAGSVVWRCRCDCGKEIEISYNSLVSGNTKSCGCLKMEHEAPALRYVDGTCVDMLERTGLRRDNTSGYTGVTETKRGWHAQIVFKGKTYHLGTYSKIEDAVQARSRAEEKLFDAFLEEYYEANKNQTMKNTKKETLKNAPNRNTRLSAATPACVGSSSQAQVVLTE